MKKILILAYDFPPYNSVGALRPFSWFKYFKKHGLSPVMVTRQWKIKYNNIIDYIAPSESEKSIIEESAYGVLVSSPYVPNIANRLLIKYGDQKYILIRRIISAYYEFKQWFFLSGPKIEVFKAADEYLKKNSVDYIIATGDPFILFKYASVLSSKYNIPWFADYRDDWIKNHTRLMNKSLINRIFLFFESFFEKKYIKNCSGIISVSEFLTKQIALRTHCKRSITIENGADLEEYVKTKNPFNPLEFNILYSGKLYNLPYLKTFFDGFDLFMSDFNSDSRIKVYFIGIEGYSNQATDSVYKYQKKFESHIFVEKKKNSTEIAQYQLHANLLLNLIAGDPEKGLIGAKSYNYAVTGNPILTIPNTFSKTSPFFPGRDIQYIANTPSEVNEFLKMTFQRFCSGSNYKTSITPDEIFKLSREYTVKRLVSFVKNESNEYYK